jgi:hypothetical protein
MGLTLTPDQWKELYGDIKEQILSSPPPPLGLPMHFTAYVDADQQQGHTLLTDWVHHLWCIVFKKQDTMEAAMFRSELIALQICMESLTA